ncbi:exonuclease domain-containing protein [Nafulsella turpanensis]|uniref:exonuclease domain-containing protein n=1 Tax=Nafulsella turpanensis TaxID=1265690 RepID=UPI00036B8881
MHNFPSNLKLKNPLAVFDIESTGINVCTDRIVEISVIKLLPDGKQETYTYRVNPTVPIPAEASMIHGIYDKDVKDEPRFEEIAPVLNRVLNGCDLGGFNHLKFDIPILMEEFSRAGIEFEIKNRKLIDAQKIFHLMEKRTLSAAYKFYCEKDLADAHSAEADTKATLDVILAQIERYEGQTVEDSQGNKIGILQNDVEQLHKLFNHQMVDLAGRFVYNQDGVEVFNFGKHKFRPVLEVLKEEPGLYDWMMRGEFPIDTKKKLTELRLKSLNNAF